jgi:hypothetical protein
MGSFADGIGDSLASLFKIVGGIILLLVVIIIGLIVYICVR